MSFIKYILFTLIVGFCTSGWTTDGNWQVENVTSSFDHPTFKIIKISPIEGEQTLRYQNAYIDVDSPLDEKALDQACGFLAGKDYVHFSPSKAQRGLPIFLYITDSDSPKTLIRIRADFQVNNFKFETMPNMVSKRVLHTIYCRTVAAGELAQIQTTTVEKTTKLQTKPKKTVKQEKTNSQNFIPTKVTPFEPFTDFTCDPKNYTKEIEEAFIKKFPEYFISDEYSLASFYNISQTAYEGSKETVILKNPKNWQVQKAAVNSDGSILLESADVFFLNTTKSHVLVKCLINKSHDRYYYRGKSGIRFIYKGSNKLEAKTRGEPNGCLFDYLLDDSSKWVNRDVWPEDDAELYGALCINDDFSAGGGYPSYATRNNLDKNFWLILGVPVTGLENSK